MKYLANRRISDADDRTLAEVDEDCSRVPADALPAMLEAGDVRLAPEPEPRMKTAQSRKQVEVVDGDL